MKQLFEKSSFPCKAKMIVSFNSSNASLNNVRMILKRKFFAIALILLIAGPAFAQVAIEGHILDIEGEPLPGVSVKIKGTTTGTVTDLKGYYKLSNVPTDATLEYSFLGMLTEEIEVGDKTNIDVTMVDDIKSLEEVVVVGYGSVRRANLTGAVVDIKAAELEDIPVGDLSSALDGKLAGVKISSSTGKPGESSVLRIRTESSFGRATEDVLYVIDGVITTDAEVFNLLDASEVESISVLKDAAAAVYGARAAGGVVVVKTKRGSEGKPRINYSGSYGIAQATKFPEMLSSVELAEMYNDIYGILLNSYGIVTDEDQYYSQEELDYFSSNPDNNWIDELLKVATTEKHTVNISGGSDRIKYFSGGSFYNEDGMIDLLDYSRYSMRVNVEANVTKNLTANLGLNYSYKKSMEPNFAGESQSGVLRDTYKQALTAAPWLPIAVDGKPVGNYISSNPLALINSGSYKRSNGNSAGFRAEIQYKIPFLEGLNFNCQFSRSESNDNGKEYAQNYMLYNFSENGHIIDLDSEPTVREYSNNEGIYQSSSYSKNYQLNTSLLYNKKFGSHDISSLLVYEQSESESNSFNTRIEENTILDGYDYMWAFAEDEYVWKSGSSANESGNLGIIGRINYGYDQKYLLETTFRYEASQKFHPDYRWGFFPAVSAGYVISEEDYFKRNISFINFLKARASAGIVGNDNVAAFLWTPTFTADGSGPILGGATTSAVVAKNGLIYVPSIHWQETHSYNTGLDMRLLNNHINFSADFYYRHTFNIFNRRSNLPAIVGLSSSVKPPDENYGEADARGIEIETGYENKIGDVSFNIDVIFSWDKKKEVKLFQNPAVEGSWRDDRLNDPSNQPGWIALGIMRTQDQLNDWMAKYPDYTINGMPLELGMIYYEDIRGEEYTDDDGKIAYLPPDGKIDGSDKTIIAQYTSPPFHYGFTLGASWKGIKVNATFSGIFGHKEFISKDEQTLPDPFSQDITNVFGFWSDYWTPTNTDAAYPRPFYYGYHDQMTTFWMRDGHTLRLKNLNVSYSVPQSVAQKLKITSMRLYFSSQNLWTIISPFDHKDPAVSRGYDYPLMRTYNFGINITI
jgi:TonB-linked SusC/RagA family outer membrane protein